MARRTPERSSKEMSDKHVGEAGKHKFHDLALEVDGVVFCEDCEKPLSFREADKAWPPEDQSAKSEDTHV
jgi:hypothetical protein